jgi:hypothetical protein
LSLTRRERVNLAELLDKWREQMKVRHLTRPRLAAFAAGLLLAAVPGLISPAQAQQKRANVVMLMSDDTGWADLGAYLGGATLGHTKKRVD